MGTMITRNALT